MLLVTGKLEYELEIHLVNGQVIQKKGKFHTQAQAVSAVLGMSQGFTDREKTESAEFVHYTANAISHVVAKRVVDLSTKNSDEVVEHITSGEKVINGIS